jgi:transposase InsO family protein/transposase
MPAPTPRRAFLHLVSCTALAMSLALSEVWALGPHQARGARRLEITLDLERLQETIDILAAWFRRSRRRPRHSHRERRLILEHAERFRLSAAEVARFFLLSPATAYRWMKRRRSAWAGLPEPEPFKPTAPCRRICDNRRQMVVAMARAGFDGDLTIARHLHLQGERISARSVGRFRDAPLDHDHKPERTPRPAIKEAPGPVTEAAAFAICPNGPTRPRLARLLRELSEAFTQGIAFDTQARFEAGEDPAASRSRALLRSRRAEQLAILLSRFSRIPPRKRPHYTNTERARILALKYRFRLSNRTLARLFLLDKGTLSAWNRDVDQPTRGCRPLVATLPDLPSAVAEVADRLAYVPRRLQAEVHSTLAALAEKVPLRRCRVCRRKCARPAVLAPPARVLPVLTPEHPNHYWSADITTIELRFTFHLTAIVDLFSREILAWDLFGGQPSGEQVCALFEQAVARYGKPQHFVTDQGGQFRKGALRTAVARLRVEHRKGAVGQKGSIAIIERLWRSLKDCLDTRLARTEIARTLRERIAVVIDYYGTKRPHTALGNATPAEVYRGKRSRASQARPAPRGWRGDPSPPLPVTIRHAFPEDERLPFLERVA